ncbi:Similar to U-scoloptoxin(01)-Cw1a (Cormocephalus westwoodi) [Cotesia congregata]|uniref:Similar to U-scoloptoxin(01)-Cw1a (Cormocephalus westwoodi) n=1 Tax=Cotesia congregata TaxID=51543 RepID=A0A8J2HHR9_COTCN|nr:Similar to U-scoloptoxin(01)-Cw1a (Cormocephalus westwoodi) [Cotesia congregata]
MMRLVSSFVILIVCQKIHGLDPITKDDTPRKNHAHRRAVDGSRGNKYYEPAVHDSFDIYDPYDEETDLSDYRINVPGEPGVDYPSYTRIPQTSFTCERQFRGYYADEEAGCQLFHVCDGNFLVSSFLCPIGSTFSQRYLTCDWWNKVDCSATKSFYQKETSSTSEVIDDDDEYLRKAYEMTSLQSSGNGVSAEPQDTPIDQLINETPHVNDLHSSERFPDYSNDRSLDYSQYKYSSRYTNSNSASGNRGRNSRYYSQQSSDSIENNNGNSDNDDDDNNNNNNYNDGDDQSSIKIHTIGRDRKDQINTRYNDFRPSYAPTVPTVTTTTRRFYSPTIPTIVRSTPSRSRHDLEFESSDHLYSAKGKNRGRITPPRPLTTTTTTTTTTEKVTSVTPASIKSTSSFILEVPPILKEDGSFKLNKVSFPRPAIRLRAKQNDDISTERSNSISEFSTIDLNPFSIFTSTEKPQQASESTEVNAYTRVSGTEKSQRVSEISSIEFYPYNDNSTDEQSNSLEQNDRAITRPSSSILPPFYYYSNANQHDNVLLEKSEELGNHSLLLSTPSLTSSSLSPSPTTSSPEIINIPTTLSWFQTTLESPVTDVIPLLKNEVEIKEQAYTTTVKSVEKSSSSIINTTVMDLQREIIEPPSIIFNPPLIHSLIEIENSTYPPESYEYTLVDNKNVHISTASGEESSTISDLLLSSFENNPAKDSFEEVEDAAVGESSPVEVTLTVNNDEDLDPTGELIRSLIAQHDPTSSDSIRDIEILRSNSRPSSIIDNYRRNKVVTAATADNRIKQRSRTRARVNTEPTTYSVKRRNKLKLRAEDSSTDNLPRPFSLSPPSYSSDVTLPTVDFIEPRPVHPSRIRNTETVVKDNYEIGNTKHEGLLQSSHTLFDLPKQDKLSDFQGSHNLPQKFEKNSKPVIQKNETKVETEGKVLVETQLVPALGFSLNTDEEREKFAHAVLHGLFSDVSAESNVKKKMDGDLKS